MPEESSEPSTLGMESASERKCCDSMRVLLVEDSLELRHLFARVLKHNGDEVCEASNGQEALDRLDAFAPDVVLTDVNMPGIDGFELTRRLRAMPTMTEVPIIMMTAWATNDEESEARQAGAADFLAKPFDSRALLERLGSLQR